MPTKRKPKSKPKTKSPRRPRGVGRPEEYRGEVAPIWAAISAGDQTKLVRADSAAARRAAERGLVVNEPQKPSPRLVCPVCRGRDWSGAPAARARRARNGDYQPALERVCAGCGLLLSFRRPGRVQLD